MKVPPQTSLPELLQQVCRKRGLDVSMFRFDLPATEASLAGKTLGQLRISSLKIVPRGEGGRETEREGELAYFRKQVFK